MHENVSECRGQSIEGMMSSWWTIIHERSDISLQASNRGHMREIL